MTASELIEMLLGQNVEFWFEGNNLRYRAPKGVLKKEHLQLLHQYKGEVLDQLRDRARKSISIAPVSYGQRALLFQYQMDPTSQAYNIPFVARVVSQIDTGKLNDVFQKLIDRHPMLRTTYEIQEGIPAMRIVGTREPTIAQHCVQNLSEQELFDLVYRKNREPLDLENGPLIRIHVFSKSEIDHILLVTIHHIACDGWSLGIVLRDIKAFCEAEAVEGGVSNLPPLHSRYTDFVTRQAQWVEGDEGEISLNYWKNQLSGELPIINLPLDQIRPVSRNYDGSTYSFVFDDDLYGTLISLAKNESVTLYSTLISAFQVLLMRFSGQEDILVGTPVLGRNRKEYENVVGLFINQVVMRGDLSGNPTFSQFLHKNNKNVLEALKHQDCPFPLIVEKIQPPRAAGCHPIFQVLFNLVKQTTISSIDPLLDGTAYDEPLTFGFLKLKPYPIPQQEGQFDLALEMLDNGQALLCSFRYRTDIFDLKTIARMTHCYKRLLKSITDQPNHSVWELQISDEVVPRDLPIDKSNDPTIEIPVVFRGAVHELFTRTALATPHRLALNDDNGSWTYEELDRFSNMLAGHLAQNGIVAGDVVAIYTNRNTCLVAAVLSILKAGAVFLILDSSFPSSRLAAMIEVAKPKGWLQIETADQVTVELQEYLRMDTIAFRFQIPKSKSSAMNMLKSFPGMSVNRAVGFDDPAYIIFTSGTTGTPKGILTTHGPLSHFIDWHCRKFEFKQTDKFSMLSGLSHDPLMRDIFSPLWVGASLYIPGEDKIAFSDSLADWLKSNEITVSHMTPALSMVITSAKKYCSTTKNMLPKLRYAFFAGDVLAQHHVQALKDMAPGVRCVNFYGTSETPQAMGYHVVDNLDEQKPKHVPIGKGIEGAQLLVLNKAGKLCGTGELGEIHVRTPYLSKGYINNPHLTKKKFIKNPYSDSADDVIYKTGDLGRYSDVGNVIYCGRADRQVSIRGFRIELADIEYHMRELDEISDVLVDVIEDMDSADSHGDRRLVVYYVPADNENLSVSEIRRHLHSRIPGYMVPQYFVKLTSIPMTPNGKVDRKALPKPGEAENRHLTDEAPTEMEEIVIAIWKEVLELDHVDVNDNFYEIGGHSLLSVQVISMLERKIGIRVHPREFTYQTLGQLAASIELQRKDLTMGKMQFKKDSIWRRIKQTILTGNSRD